MQGEQYESSILKIRANSFKEENRIRQQLFERQIFFHWIILFVVVVVVLSGVWLSFLQIKKSNGDATSGTMEISASGLKVQSSVIGLLMLGLSMGFFYLYLTNVYKLRAEDDPTKAGSPTQQEEKKAAPEKEMAPDKEKPKVGP